MRDDEELISTIMRALEIDLQYVAHREPWEVDEIAQIRSCGRKAGRRLGWSVTTHATDPEEREDGRVVVIVATNNVPDSERERMDERTQLHLGNMSKQLKGDGS